MTHRSRLHSFALAACAAACLCAPALAAAPAHGAPDLPRFLGRLHPLVVHFPIALLLVAVLAEIVAIAVRRERDRPSAVGLACVTVGALGAAAAAWFGWINADLEPHGRGVADHIEVHRWLGVAAAGLAGLALVAAAIGSAGRARAMTAAYRVSLVLSAAVVAAAAHWGGTIVYGEGYLTEVLFPEPATQPSVGGTQLTQLEEAPPGLTVDFATQIAPIFADHCIECHGPSKKKGNLRLDERRYVFDARAADEQVIVPGDPGASDLFFRVSLPHDDEDAMPPEGEAEPLSPEQLVLLETWIREGAVWADAPLVTAPAAGSPDAQAEIDSFAFDETAEARQSAAIERLRSRGAVAMRVSAAEPWVEVRFDLLGAEVTDADLALLAGLEPTLVAINLAGTGVTDEGLAPLGAFRRLERLHLDRTSVTDAGLGHLAPLGELRYLNLYGSQITNQGLVPIARLPKLARLYVWKTQVTPQAGALLAALRPGLIVEVDPRLSPATFEEPAGAPAPDAPSAQESPAALEAPPTEEGGGGLDVATLPGCCRAALERGESCEHPCCVEARLAGTICETCGG